MSAVALCEANHCNLTRVLLGSNGRRLRKPGAMQRRLIAAGLTVAALAMLVMLVLDSRPIPIEAHLAHHAAIAELQRSAEDAATLVASLESARASNQALGEGVRTVLTRFEQSPESLAALVFGYAGRALHEERVRSRFNAYSGTVADASSVVHTALSEQEALIRNLDIVRRTGPVLVERMRDIRLDEAARATFELVAGVLDYASPASTIDPADLQRLAAALSTNPRISANMPGQVQALVEATQAAIAGVRNVEGLTERLGEIPLAASGANLSSAAVERYRDTLAGINRARTLLSIYAIILLGAAGVIAFRLSQSYQLLNRANRELATLNESLEQRVAERTEELQGALLDLKESQVQLVQAEKMSSLGQLVAGISHEINTPLLYLANNAELIRERLELFEDFTRRSTAAFALRPDDFEDRKGYQVALAAALRSLQASIVQDDLPASIEEARELLDDSTHGLNELTEMARGLKDFSRMDRAPVESFDINAGLERSLLIAKSALKHKVNVNKFFGDLPEIQCAPSQLNQVFLNLLTNAAQAIEEQGEIVIRTERRGEEHISVTIADTGCGISEENLAKIRDPFFTTKEVGSGTGLGLAIVDQIVTAHGGELHIESEPGKGSVFTIILPINSSGNAVASTNDAELLSQLAAAG